MCRASDSSSTARELASSPNVISLGAGQRASMVLALMELHDWISTMCSMCSGSDECMKLRCPSCEVKVPGAAQRLASQLRSGTENGIVRLRKREARSEKRGANQ